MSLSNGDLRSSPVELYSWHEKKILSLGGVLGAGGGSGSWYLLTGAREKLVFNNKVWNH